MPESPLLVALLLVALLTVSTLCLVAMTVAILMTSRELRRTLRRINGVLPTADRALRELERSLQAAHQVLTTAHGAAQHVEAVIRRTHEAMSATLERVHGWTSQVERLWGSRSGNGAGGASRHSHRRR